MSVYIQLNEESCQKVDFVVQEYAEWHESVLKPFMAEHSMAGIRHQGRHSRFLFNEGAAIPPTLFRLDEKFGSKEYAVNMKSTAGRELAASLDQQRRPDIMSKITSIFQLPTYIDEDSKVYSPGLVNKVKPYILILADSVFKHMSPEARAALGAEITTTQYEEIMKSAE